MSIGHEVRAEFPIFEHAVYANSCSQGALANRVRAAAEEWLAGWDENGAEWEFWVERNEAARAAFARLLHAEPDDVAVTTSVSQGVSALVSALDLSGERNRIVISEYEFPTVGQIAHAQELRGAEVVHVTPEADGRIPLERFAEAIDERTALVCCTALSFRTGSPQRRVRDRRARHASGALLLADSYQAIGALELDVRTLGADVVTGGTVKYLLGSAGLGFMWVRELPALAAAPDADRLVRRRGHLRDVHRRLLAARDCAALRQRHAAGALALSRRRGDGADRRGRRAGDRGARAWARRPTPVRARRPRRNGRDGRGDREYGPLICVVSTDPNALVDALAAERIVTSTRDSNLRISLHLYNVEADVDRILAALAASASSSPRRARRRRARRSRPAARRGAADRASATRGSTC